MGGKESKGLAKKLDERTELLRIKALYEDLSAASKGRGIDLDTFKQLLGFPDPIGGQAFRVFDHKKHGLINLEDFTNGMALCARGSEKDKTKALFRVFDHDDDKHIHKAQVKTILVALAGTELWSASSGADHASSKPPSALVQSMMEMGFPRDLCEKATEATKNEGLDSAINWMLANKIAPEKEVQDLIDSMFESAGDSLSWSKFKKWALSSKRPARFLVLINVISGIYTRAAQYLAPVKPVVTVTPAAPREKPQDLIDFSAPFEDPEKGEKKIRRSLSMRLKRKTSQNNVADPGLFHEGPIPAPSTPPLTPQKPVDPNTLARQRPVSVSGIAAIDLTASIPSPATTTTPPPNRVPSSFNLAPSPTSTSRTRAVTVAGTGGPPQPKSLAGSAEINLTTSTEGVAPPPQKPLGDDDWSDSDEEKEHKPAIQVVIKERSELAPASGIDLKKFASQLSLDVPKSKSRGNTVGSRRGHRQSTSRLSLDQAFEDNKDSSFGPPRSESPPATATSTSTPATPSTPAVPSSGSASGQSTPVAAKPAEDDWFAPRASPATPALSITVPAQPSPGLSQTSPRNSTPTLARSITSPALPQPASSQQSPQPATSPQQPPQRPTVAAQDAAEFMKNGMALLEKGSFSEALENVDNSIRVFLSKPDPQAVKGETNFCVAYKVALWLLIAIRELEGTLASQFGENTEVINKMALWSKFLTEIPLKPNHRAVCVRMAIKRNMQAKNYGIAGKLLEALLLKGAPDREELQGKLRKCKDENNTNAALPAYNCPSCGNECSPASLKCNCGRPVRWCFKSFEVITEKAHVQCSFCNAIFSSKVYTAGDSCYCCFTGPLQQKD